MNASGWTKIKPDEVIFKGWRTVIKKTFKNPNGRELVAETTDPIGNIAIATLALTKDNQVIIMRNFRCGPEKMFDELPGGGGEDGEDPRSAAVRELREETGYVPGKVEYLGKVYKHAWLNTTWHYYFATECTLSTEGRTLDDFEEGSEVHLISVEKLFDNAKNARMTDTEAVFLAYDKLRELETV